MTISEVKQIANNLAIQDRLTSYGIHPFQTWHSLEGVWALGYDWSSKTSQECLQHKHVDT